MDKYLQHHGILGQRWGVRRFQNADGSLTKAGQKRYGESGSRTTKQTVNRLNDLEKAVAYNKRNVKDADAVLEGLGKKYQKKFKGQEFSSDDFSKRDKKLASDSAKKKLSSQTRIQEGQEEINNILKNSEKMHIKSWESKYDTTRGKEIIADTLLIAGAAGLGLVPGPNVAAAVAVGNHINRTKRNTIDIHRYKVESEKAKTTNKAPSPYDLVRMPTKEANKSLSNVSDKALKKQYEASKKAAKVFEERNKPQPGHVNMVYDETMDTFNKSIRMYEKELNRRQ